MDKNSENILENNKTIETFLTEIRDSDCRLKYSSSSLEIGHEEKKLIKSKILKLIESEKKGDCVLLSRGLKKNVIQKRLISKLNSNDSLYDGLFLVGDKAKNFLKKESDIPHPIKIITNTGFEVANWIFEEYENIKSGPINLEYFKNGTNKEKFAKKVKDKTDLIDYYLFGLHTFNSDSLVNFVSSTSSLDVAMNHDNDLIIIFWLPKGYKHLCIYKEKLDALKGMMKKLNLPILNNSFHPEENEYSMKGFILPHYILCVFDMKENAIIINPRILEEKNDWINDGFDIDGIDFREFIESTEYKRFLTLTDQTSLNENYVC